MKKLAKLTAVLLTGIMALSACTKKGSKDSEDYYYIFVQDITTLNFLVTALSVDADAIATSMDPLVLVNNKGAFEPGLATKWEQSSDGLTWTFHLRKGVKWQKSDGSFYGPEVKAQDFVDAMEYILDPNLASDTVDFMLDFVAGAEEYYTAKDDGGNPDISTVGVKAVDDYTLEYTTTDVYPFFASLMSYSCYLPICKQFVEEIGGIDNFGTSNENFLYYGEYLFTTWDRDQHWIFEKNQEYYYADRVNIKKLDYVFVEDGAVQLEMYKRGEISAAGLSSDKADLALADPELKDYVYRTRTDSSSWQFFFQVNTDPGPESLNLLPALNNVNFRKAVFSSIDRVAILAVSNKFDPAYLLRNTLNIWNLSSDDKGKDYMTYGNLSKYEADGFDYYNETEARSYLAKAKEELGDTVSWPITISYLTTNSETGIKRANVLKQSIEDSLGKENVIIEFYEIPGSDYYAKQSAGAFDLTYSGWIPDYADPASLVEIYQKGGYLGATNGNYKLDGFDEFERLMVSAKSQSKLSDRYAGIAAAEEYLIDNAFVMPYSALGGNYAINNVQNPYDGFRMALYGLSNSMWKDVVYGSTPLTLEEREALKAEFEASLKK